MSARKQTQIVALLLTLLVLFAATKIRTVEAPKPGEELRICQYDADSVATISHQFFFRPYDTAVPLPPPGGEIPWQSPTPFSRLYRGPPVLF